MLSPLKHVGYTVAGLMCGCAVVAGQLLYGVLTSWALSAPAKKTEVIVTKNIAYGNDSEKQKLDLYLPEMATPEAPAPVLIFFHGGGWSAGSKQNYQAFAKMIAARGYAVVVPNYRLYPKVTFPAFVEDAAAATRWVQDHLAEATGGRSDSTRLVLSGHSAGAHLATLVAFDRRYLDDLGANSGPTAISGVIGISGPYAMLPSKVPPITEIFGDHADDLKTMPLTVATGGKGQPPALLLHGRQDWLVPLDQTRQLETAIRDSGGEVEAVAYDEFRHIDIMPHFRAPRENDPVTLKILEFLEARTRPR